MSEVAQIRQDRPETKPTNGNGGGNGRSLVNHRLSDLERRMGVIEEDLKQLTNLCTQINTRLDGMATESFVWKAFGVTGGLALATLLAHIGLRTLG